MNWEWTKTKASTTGKNLFEIVSGRHTNHLPTLIAAISSIRRTTLRQSITDRLFDQAGMMIYFDKENNWRQAA